MYACPYCQKSFAWKSRLTTHLFVHNKQPFSCSKCSKSYKRMDSLRKHIQCSHGEYTCNICDKTLKDSSSYNNHVKMHEDGSYDILCKECNKAFPSLRKLNEHVDAMHNKLHTCEICKKSVASAQSLRVHKLTHEEGHITNRPYKCDMCDRSFVHKTTLNAHIRRNHYGELNYVCDVCGKKLSSVISLRDHKLLHDGIKPIKCTECGKCFAKQSTLTVHVRMHTGARPYECDECKKTFTQRSTLVIHRRLHTGERPYKCDICEEGFVSKYLLNMHMNKKHNILK